MAGSAYPIGNDIAVSVIGMKKFAILVSAALCAAVFSGGLSSAIQAASGGTLSVAIKDARGMPLRDAVVMVYPSVGTAGRGFRGSSNIMNQQDLQFKPGTLIVAQGDTVSFPNRDRVRHNVYSFSRAAKFKMKLYAKDETRSHRFPVAGSVALGCNIHDDMKGYIKVVDTPFAAKTDHNGRLRISGIPAGFARVKAWHPRNRTRTGESSYSFPISGSGVTNKTMTLSLR